MHSWIAQEEEDEKYNGFFVLLYLHTQDVNTFTSIKNTHTYNVDSFLKLEAIVSLFRLLSSCSFRFSTSLSLWTDLDKTSSLQYTHTENSGFENVCFQFSRDAAKSNLFLLRSYIRIIRNITSKWENDWEQMVKDEDERAKHHFNSFQFFPFTLNFFTQSFLYINEWVCLCIDAFGRMPFHSVKCISFNLWTNTSNYWIRPQLMTHGTRKYYLLTLFVYLIFISISSHSSDLILRSNCVMGRQNNIWWFDCTQTFSVLFYTTSKKNFLFSTLHSILCNNGSECRGRSKKRLCNFCLAFIY